MKKCYILFILAFMARIYAGVTIDTEKIYIPKDLINEAQSALAEHSFFALKPCEALCSSKDLATIEEHLYDGMSLYTWANVVGLAENLEEAARTNNYTVFYDSVRELFGYHIERIPITIYLALTDLIKRDPILPLLFSMRRCTCALKRGSNLVRNQIEKEFKDFVLAKFPPATTNPLHITELGSGELLATLTLLDGLIKLGYHSFILDLIDPTYTELIEKYQKKPSINNVHIIAPHDLYEGIKDQIKYTLNDQKRNELLQIYKKNNAFIAFINWFKNQDVALTLRLYKNTHDYINEYRNNPNRLPNHIILANDVPFTLSQESSTPTPLIDFNTLRIETLNDPGLAIYFGLMVGAFQGYEGLDYFSSVNTLSNQLQEFLNNPTIPQSEVTKLFEKIQKGFGRINGLFYGTKNEIIAIPLHRTGMTRFGENTPLTKLLQFPIRTTKPEAAPQPAPEPGPAAGPSAPTLAALDALSKTLKSARTIGDITNIQSQFEHALNLSNLPSDIKSNKQKMFNEEVLKSLAFAHTNIIAGKEKAARQNKITADFDTLAIGYITAKDALRNTLAQGRSPRKDDFVHARRQIANIKEFVRALPDDDLKRNLEKTVAEYTNEIDSLEPASQPAPQPAPKPAGPSAPTAKPTTAPVAEPAKASKLTYAQLRKATEACITQLKEAMTLEQINSIETNCKNIIKNSGLDIGSQVPLLERLNGELKKRKVERSS